MDVKTHTVTIPFTDYEELKKNFYKDYKEILMSIFQNGIIINNESAYLLNINIGDKNFTETLPVGTNKTKNAMWRSLHNKLIVQGVRSTVAVVVPTAPPAA